MIEERRKQNIKHGTYRTRISNMKEYGFTCMWLGIERGLHIQYMYE